MNKVKMNKIILFLRFPEKKMLRKQYEIAIPENLM